MRVSKDWHPNFAQKVWSSICFGRDCAVLKSSSEAIAKYGGYISYALGVASSRQCDQDLEFPVVENPEMQRVLPGLISGCQGTLLSLKVYSIQYFAFQEMNKELALLGLVPAAFMSLRNLTPLYFPGIGIESLMTLTLSNVCTHRAGFSQLLWFCPRLYSLRLDRFGFIPHDHNLKLFTYSSVQHMSATVKEALVDGNSKPYMKPLLVHFPHLKSWDIQVSPRAQELAQVLGAQIKKSCPKLKHVDITQNDTKAVGQLLSKSFVGLESCTFPYCCLSLETASGLVNHMSTLKSIVMSTLNPANSSNPDPILARRLLRTILSQCRHLEVLSMETHVMEATHYLDEWSCLGLKELRMRFGGLETASDIERRLTLLRVCKVSRLGQTSIPIRLNHSAIACRIVNKLLTLKQLKTVCIGAKECYLATN
ncbi:hypothetical protein BGX23_004597 [Mortierella sp. AD031]|nr:hypothetical protein BGX23_004597 [Mortierella sp. AD031]